MSAFAKLAKRHDADKTAARAAPPPAKPPQAQGAPPAASYGAGGVDPLQPAWVKEFGLADLQPFELW